MKLSERQKRTVAAALTVISAVVIIAAIGALVYLLSSFVSRFSHVLLPLAVAGVIALILKPYQDFFVDRLHLPPVLALGAVFILLLLPVAGLSWFFGGLVVDQVTDLVTKAPGWWQETSNSLQERWPKIQQLMQRYDLQDRLQDATESHGDDLYSAIIFLGEQAWSAGAGIFGALGSLLSWAVLPIYVAFFLLADPDTDDEAPPGNWADTALPFLKAETRENVTYLVNEFVNIIVAFFRGQLLIAFLQGLLFALGFTIIGLKYGFILGLMLGFLNIIPYLGSMIGLGVAFPLGMFQPGGGLSLVIGVLVVFTLVQMIEGYILTPRIMGETTGLHPMVIIVAIFFWGSALPGLSGLILAIPLTAFFVVFWRLLRENYIGELL